MVDQAEPVTYCGPMRSMESSELKDRCLTILDEVERTGESVTILKRGQPVAVLIPLVHGRKRYPQESLFGTVEILGDIIDIDL